MKLNSTGVLNCTDLYDDVVFIRDDKHIISNDEKYEIINNKILRIKNVGKNNVKHIVRF